MGGNTVVIQGVTGRGRKDDWKEGPWFWGAPVPASEQGVPRMQATSRRSGAGINQRERRITNYTLVGCPHRVRSTVPSTRSRECWE